MPNLYNDSDKLLKQAEVQHKRVMKILAESKEVSVFDDVDKEVHLVTGGLGHIGSYIVEYLAGTRSNAKIIVVDNYYNGKDENIDSARSKAAGRMNEIIVEMADISVSAQMYDIFEKHKPQFVYHQASMLTLDSARHRRRAIDVNIVGFANILELCILFQVKKLVFASSASVFGDPEYIPVDEEHGFNNCSMLYGATKVANEFLAKSYADQCGLKLVGLRYFNVYGYRQSTKNIYTQIVPKWINAFIDGEPIELYGDGKQTMDMIHGYDVGRLNVLAMSKPIVAMGEVIRWPDWIADEWEFPGFINIGTGVQTSVNDLYYTIRHELNKAGVDTTKSTLVNISHDPALVRKRQCDCELMHKLLGKHEMDVDYGIEVTVKKILNGRK